MVDLHHFRNPPGRIRNVTKNYWKDKRHIMKSEQSYKPLVSHNARLAVIQKNPNAPS